MVAEVVREVLVAEVVRDRVDVVDDVCIVSRVPLIWKNGDVPGVPTPSKILMK